MEEQQFQKVEDQLNKELENSKSKLSSFLSTALKKLEDKSTLNLVLGSGSKTTSFRELWMEEVEETPDEEDSEDSADDSFEDSYETNESLFGPYPLLSFLKEKGIVDTVTNRLSNLNVPSVNVELVVSVVSTSNIHSRRRTFGRRTRHWKQKS
eukprot:Blabericola_migrator_1__3988@NODE_2209_length_3119_cov_87_495085_g1391_i0_p3_GENE_NODE_2209_length_3119_cov_87_495085_g1391_i0NODE_2209_length_3119_cov_87_495085_g1391_i0_p3_ORF_typecomplete_len153_score26_84V_ATPase_I/PF01496_19/0_042_NODE_2209_length_3119_cov_87_495085_g1391_i014841942